MLRPVLAALAALSLTACLREDPNAVPDRQGHAFVHGAEGGSTATGGGGGTGASSDPNPGTGETTVTVQPGESLYQIAERHQVALRWLIERNGLERRAQPGDRIIVPAR